MTTTKTKSIHGYVTDEAHAHWHEFATEHGVSVSALLEVLGPMLADDTDPDALWRTSVARAVLVARRVDAANRRRNRR